MNKTLTRYSIIFFAYLAVLYPIWMRVKNLSWALDYSLLGNLFPVFGLAAFTILWLHVISGVFESWLRNYIDFDLYVRNTSIIVLISIILHPLLLIIMMGENFADLYSYGWYIRLGIIGWLLLITYDIGKALKKKYPFFERNWTAILFISTVGFLLTFFHSLYLGSDLQAQPMRGIWTFYGVTAIAATIYTYGIKRFLNPITASTAENPAR